MTEELWRWGAAELADAIRTRRVSAREAVASCLDRAHAVNRRLNAVVELLPERALAAAARLDDMTLRGESAGSLHGVPVTIKVNTDQAGCATTNGVAAYRNMIARHDSPPVANWRKAGAVIIGRTNTPAFSWRWFTDNELHGRTLNPWGATRTPGGSSGGAAVAVAVGIGALAHGADQGGSIRYPAYACGIPGIRPSLGRVPGYDPGGTGERAIFAQISITHGTLARSIRDLRLGLEAMAAFDPRDPWWVPAAAESPPGPVRVALCRSIPGLSVHPAVSRAVEQAGLWLGEAGYRVEEAIPPRFREAADLWLALAMVEAAGNLEEMQRVGDAAIRRVITETLAWAPKLDLDGYIERLTRRSTILQEWLLFLQERPLLLMPVSLRPIFGIDFDQEGFQAMRCLLDAQSPLLASAALGLPALAVPTGLDDGLPMGVQLVAARFQEALCFAAGEVIEASAPTLVPIDPRH